MIQSRNMEKPNLHRENITGSKINGAFFSKENVKRFLGNGAVTLGTVFALAGIAEFVTGEKIGNYLEAYRDQIPGAIDWVVSHLDNMPLILKLCGGSSLIGTGIFINSSLK